MRWTAVAILGLLALCSVARADDTAPVTLSVWAVQATKETGDKPVDQADRYPTAQTTPPPGAAPPGTLGLTPGSPAPRSRATGGEKQYDSGLDMIKTALASLPFDRFKRLASERTKTKVGEEATVKIDSRYTLFATPESRSDDGRVRMQVRLEMARGDDKPPAKAVDTTLLLAPGKMVNLGGFKMDQGELVIVMVVAE